MTPLEQLLRYTLARPNGCIEWTGGKDQDGYGLVQIEGKTRRVSRVVWAMVHGEDLPSEVVVRHSCDNPPCANPSHLLSGTALDNVRDCVERGRRSDRRGELCPTAKLTWPAVREIRRVVSEGATHTATAAQFGVSRRLVGRIVNREIWIEEQVA